MHPQRRAFAFRLRAPGAVLHSRPHKCSPLANQDPGRSRQCSRTLHPATPARRGQGRGARRGAHPGGGSQGPRGNRRAAGSGRGRQRGGAGRGLPDGRAATRSIHYSSARPGHSREPVAPSLQKEPGGETGFREASPLREQRRRRRRQQLLQRGKTAAALRLQASDSDLDTRSQ